MGAGLRSVSSHIRECGWECVKEDLKALEDRSDAGCIRKCFVGFPGIECAWKSLSVVHGYATRVLAYGSDGLKGVEHRYARLAASLVGAEWPTRRWPIHVFTAGAMTCLFTSSFCHLFGCCSWHFAQVPSGLLAYHSIKACIRSWQGPM